MRGEVRGGELARGEELSGGEPTTVGNPIIGSASGKISMVSISLFLRSQFLRDEGVCILPPKDGESPGEWIATGLEGVWVEIGLGLLPGREALT
jgi:hypothetical protein